MDTDFEQLKNETEAELGRQLDTDEIIWLKALLYFSKGCKLKAEKKALVVPGLHGEKMSTASDFA